MTETNSCIIELLRLGLGLSRCDDCSFPNQIDWNLIVNQAIDCEMEAVVSDGLQLLFNNNPSIIKGFLLPENKPIRNQLFGKAILTENKYESQKQAAISLGEVFYRHNIRTIVLKGFSINQFYPNPAHRPSCDFDCFLLTEYEDKPIAAYELGNSVVSSLGIRVDTSYYKNSEFTYRNLMVENHRFCCSIKRGREVKQLESFLQTELMFKTRNRMENSHLEFPSICFLGLFQLEHSYTHFLYGKQSIKHICDWTLFKKENDSFVKGEYFNQLCDQYGLLRYKKALDGIADYLNNPREHSLSSTESRLLQDAFSKPTIDNSASAIHVRIMKIQHVFHSRWKFQLFSNTGRFQELWNTIVGFLFVHNPQI